MRNQAFCLLCSFILVVIFVTPVIASLSIYYERQSPSSILVKIENPRSGVVRCDISSHSGESMGADSWYHNAPFSNMIINVPANIIDPEPEVNCTISYD